MVTGLKYVLLFEIMYVVATALVKVSICMSILRYAVNPAPRVTLYVVTALVISFSIFLVFFALFQCVPVSKFWTRIVEVTPPGTCQDPHTVIAVTYAHSAVVTVVDWTLATFPIFIVWNIQISLNTKIYLALVLGLGSISCIATIARFPYIHILGSLNTVFEDTNLASWSCIEVGMALIACSLATLRPLTHKMAAAYGYEMHQLKRRWTGSRQATAE
ncbi:hypothetical protein N7486_004048 [Penicillium sp. IBT 16267x]|nr:hypothetical protein N7486_004048 [Penicillium sp. IBT 16267x]